jgi:ribosomal protein L2
VLLLKKLAKTSVLRHKKKINTYFIQPKLKRLTISLKSTGGRNNLGTIVVRHRKNIIKRKLLIIDQLRLHTFYPARVKKISKLYLKK